MSTPDLNHPAFADFYDELPLWSAPFAQKILERAPLRRGQTVVDLGCGTGFLALELAQRSGPGSKVYAVDLWAAAMARLERKAVYLGVGNVELVTRDGADTGLADSTADLVVCNLGLNNFADPDAVLAEVFRVTKPGGRLILTTNPKGHMAEVYSALRYVIATLGVGDGRDALAAQEDHRGTPESVAARLRRAGFTDIEVDEDEHPMRFADGTAMLGHWFMRMAFLPDWLSVVSPQVAPQVLIALESRLNAMAKGKGELALTIPVALFEARKA